MKRPRLRYLPVAKEAAQRLTPAVKPLIKEGIEDLLDNPYAGKELLEELAVFRSLIIGKYRVIYRLDDDSSIEIHFIGHRRDVYMNFRKMLEGIKG